MGHGVWDVHADEHGEVAFDAELVVFGDGDGLGEEAGAVFGVEVDDVLSAVEGGVRASVLPEGSVESGVEAVVEGEEVADFVPASGHEAVVDVLEVRAGLTEGIDEGICDGAALGAEDHECGGFEWFDEACGVADGDGVADP